MRGAEWLQNRIQSAGYKKDCSGVLWSMVRGADRTHADIIEGFQSEGAQPFQTQIPLAAQISNATAQFDELTDEQQPKTFRGKYGTRFGRIYESLCEEIMERLPERKVKLVASAADAKLQQAQSS